MALNSLIDNISNALLKSTDEIHKKAIASLTDDSYDRRKIEKLYVLPNENFEAVDFRPMGVIEEEINMLPKFIEGEKYSLQGVACDGFNMPNKTYELVCMVDEFYGVKVDYVLMKQLDGEKGQIYTFSKNDCTHLGIEYQDGLQPFPKSMPWKRVKENVEFNKHDLATTPRSEVDNSIRYILLKINGFKDYSDGYVLSPSGKLIKEELFEKSLRVINNEPIVYGNGVVMRDKTRLNTKIVYPNELLYTHGNFISQDNTVYVLITLKQNASKLSLRNKNAYIDDNFGVEPKYFSNIDPHNLFTVAWDEFACLTIEEYEAAKEKAKKIALEKIKKEEELRKKQIAQKEAEEKEFLKRNGLTVSRQEKFNRFPSFPKDIQFEVGNIAAISMYADTMNKYFFKIDKELNEVIRDLDTFSKRRNLDAAKLLMVPY